MMGLSGSVEYDRVDEVMGVKLGGKTGILVSKSHQAYVVSGILFK